VQYHDRFIDKKNQTIYIIMEYCAGGDLQKIIKRCISNKEQISEDFIWKIFAQIVSGLHFCHRRTDLNPINRGDTEINQQGPQKILHRDLKPGNIFLDASNDAKVGDFGLARVMNCDSVYASTQVGTPYYMSPEQINEQKYNEKSDIWSLGCIIYEMASLRPPFKA
jgi:NIMA (never in mitosis gene a)-related kinase